MHTTHPRPRVTAPPAGPESARRERLDDGRPDRHQRNRAKRMKHQGDHRDVDILENLILAVTSSGQITE